MYWTSLLQAFSWTTLVFVLLSIGGVVLLHTEHKKSGDQEALRRNNLQGYVYWGLLPFTIAAVLTWGL